MATARETLQAAIDELGLTVRAEFVPWSESRHRGEPTPSLNWKVTLVRDGRDVLTTDYGAGPGHCPSYKHGDRSKIQRELIARECEHGFAMRWSANIDAPTFVGVTRRKPILPDTCSVVASLVSDSDALNYPRFEEWASDNDVDPDSRAGEACYRASLEIALALRNGVGEDGLRKLTEACQDF